MKKIITFLIVIGLLIFPVMPAFSQSVGPGQIPTQIGGNDVNGSNVTTISGWVGILLTVVRWIYTIIFIIAVLFILIAAFNFITSKGDTDKVKEAKNQLLYAAIGIAVALLSYAIVTLVKNSLNTGFTS